VPLPSVSLLKITKLHRPKRLLTISLMNADNSLLHNLRPLHDLDILLHSGLYCYINRGGKKTTRNLAAYCITGCDFQPEPARGQDGGDK
jgi:hypothetical protein